MSMRFPPSSGGGGGGSVSHDMIRFTPDDPSLAASMSPLRLVDPSTPGADYGVATAERGAGSLCRHRVRRAGDPSAWLDDGGPYATYYCSCRRREPRTKTAADPGDDGPAPAGRDAAAGPPDVAVAPPPPPPVYGTGVASRPCGHPRQHVVVCTTAGATDKIYDDRYSCKYSTFLGGGGDDALSRASRAIALDGRSGSHHVIDVAAVDDDVVTSSASAADAARATPVNL